MVSLVIDGKRVGAFEGETLLQVAQRVGIWIPTLCYHPSLRPYGACRVCVVEVEGKEKSRLVVSCAYPVKDGLVVWTDSERVREARKKALEVLFSRSPHIPALEELADRLGVARPKESGLDGCVLCGLCVRCCEEIAKAGVLIFMGKGDERKVMTAQSEEPSSLCIGCGGCAYLCPTGYISLKDGKIMLGYQVIKELQPQDHRRAKG